MPNFSYNFAGQGRVSADSLVLAGMLRETGKLTPSAITGTVNDYSPAGWLVDGVGAYVEIAQDISAAVTLTGLTGGVDGLIVTIRNLTASNSRILTIADENAGSVAANRFHMPLYENVPIPVSLMPGCAATFKYDGSISRWRLLWVDSNNSHGTGGTYGGRLYAFNFVATGVIAPAITANQNDWFPPSFSVAEHVFAAPDADRTITGMLADGTVRRVFLVNNSAFNLTLAHESASSAAANRFHLTGAANLVIPAQAGVLIVYHAAMSRWRVIAKGF